MRWYTVLPNWFTDLCRPRPGWSLRPESTLPLDHCRTGGKTHRDRAGEVGFVYEGYLGNMLEGLSESESTSWKHLSTKMTPRFAGGSTLALILRKSWFITARFHSIHLRAYFSRVNVTIALIVFYLSLC